MESGDSPVLLLSVLDCSSTGLHTHVAVTTEREGSKDAPFPRLIEVWKVEQGRGDVRGDSVGVEVVHGVRRVGGLEASLLDPIVVLLFHIDKDAGRGEGEMFVGIKENAVVPRAIGVVMVVVAVIVVVVVAKGWKGRPAIL